MHRTKLSDLVDQIILKYKNGAEVDWSRKYLYTYLDFLGGENSHLSNPLNLDSDKRNRSNRRSDEHILTGDEMVRGDILVYDSCGHDASERIFVVETLAEAEEHILNPGGILNSYTSNMAVFMQGKVVPYEIYIKDDKGNRLVFDKSGESEDVFTYLLENGMNVRLTWLEEEEDAY